MRGATLIKVVAAAFVAIASGCTDNKQGEVRGDGPATAVPADDEINLDLWLERLEVGSRELYSAREEVVEALSLEEGGVVADIGAGTGLYSLLFAEAVGPTGRVFAEDIEPLFLDLINRRAEDAGFHNITAVFGREDDVTLPNDAIDVVFIADTYHYFENREDVMKSVYRSLKPGGSLVIVDYDLEPGAERPSDKSHIRFGKAGVISEIEFIGFEFAEEPEVEGLNDNYLVRFVKPAE
ncbi:methyltransferase domain-containing protein [Hyphococcus flavus]|uniref:Methyltransferase domain-containing protein n=1 Tax=Hyphococcus flavus TaxID=1866326 RepID=A0AAE9ZBG3_9PROT|nr:methyltransferase domain-containing protein [Hyphococcus flavus]WDI31644.1 methyltransferase domain-containing protein [Hyphococcus flavus]